MPVIEPKSFNALELFPFQINPHYINQKKDGFNSETRAQRLEEFMEMNRGATIVCLPEGTAIQLKSGVLKFIRNSSGILFHQDKNAETFVRKEIAGETDLSYLL